MKFRKLKQWKYQLTEQLEVELTPNDMPFIDTEFITLRGNWIILAKYYAYDGASGPCPDFKCVMIAAAIHDGLYQLMRLGLLDKKYRQFADAELRRVCLKHDMPKWFAFLMYWGVRIGAGRGVYPLPELPIYEIK